MEEIELAPLDCPLGRQPTARGWIHPAVPGEDVYDRPPGIYRVEPRNMPGKALSKEDSKP